MRLGLSTVGDRTTEQGSASDSTKGTLGSLLLSSLEESPEVKDGQSSLKIGEVGAKGGMISHSTPRKHREAHKAPERHRRKQKRCPRLHQGPQE